MFNIVLFGPPGAGKGTQASILEDKYGFQHLSTGEVIRNQIAEGTVLGMQAKNQMAGGGLVDDDIVCQIVADYVVKHKEGFGVIFDGFPRTTAQAQRFDTFLAKQGQQVSAMIALTIPNDEIIRRIVERGKVSGRADDQNTSIIQNRIDTYDAQTAVVAEFYKAQGKYFEIDGTGTIDEVNSLLCGQIDALLKK